jgi:hypothetical protein
VLATCISALTSLETLWLEFASPPRGDPSLKGGADFHLRREAMSSGFKFDGANTEYLGVIVDKIDPFRLEFLEIHFHEQDFDNPQLQFISHAPKLMALEKATAAGIRQLR